MAQSTGLVGSGYDKNMNANVERASSVVSDTRHPCANSPGRQDTCRG